MKKIKIFLGSSIIEFEKERNDLELFIRNISDEFEEKYNIKLVPLRCENIDNYVRTDGTQNAINEELVLGSDMCLFIFFTKAGEFTEEEFRIAFEKFKKDGKPKIYIYFKNIPEGQTVEESVYNFMSKIDNELKHYHGSFDHIDTIKLRILLNLKLQEMDFVSVEFENGKCIVDGKQTLDLSNVSEFANNNILQQLKKELTEVEDQYFQMKPIYEKGNVSGTFYKEYVEVSSKRHNLLDSIEELQKNIFNMSLRICKDEVHGDITIRQKEAYRLFELGDYEGAVTVLDPNDIDNDFLAFEKQEEEKLKKRVQIYIKEHKTAIDILKCMYQYKNRNKEIKERYNRITKVSKKYLIELDVFYNFAIWLYEKGDIESSFLIATELEEIYTQNTELCVSEKEKSSLFSLIATVVSNFSDLQDYALKYLSMSIRINKRLLKTNPSKISSLLAINYNNFACLCTKNNKYRLAEKYLKKSIGILENNKENTYIYYIELLQYYNNLSKLYFNQKDYSTPVKILFKALSISNILLKDCPDNRISLYLCKLLAETYYNFSFIYDNENKYYDAIKFLNKAINIYNALSDEFSYLNISIADIYTELGNIYSKTDEIENNNSIAKENYLIAQKNFDNFIGDKNTDYYKGLIFLYKNEGLLFAKLNDFENAENLFFKMIKISEFLYEQNKKQHTSSLVNNYIIVGEFYRNFRKKKLSKDYFLTAIYICELAFYDNPEIFMGDIIHAYLSYNTFRYRNKAFALVLQYKDNQACREVLNIIKKNNNSKYINRIFKLMDI